MRTYSSFYDVHDQELPPFPACRQVPSITSLFALSIFSFCTAYRLATMIFVPAEHMCSCEPIGSALLNYVSNRFCFDGNN